MKIRDRLTYNLSITGFIAVTILGVLVYSFSAQFYQQQFFNRLDERVALSELMFLEDEETKQAIRDQFLKMLDEEEEYAISMQPSGLDSMRQLFAESLPLRILENDVIRFIEKDRLGVARKYKLDRGEYVVVVTAVDTIGKQNLRFLKRILIIGGIGVILLLVIVYRVGIIRALDPLENKIRRASLISADKLDTRLHVQNPSDEVGELAIAFNRMLDRLQGAFEAQKHFVRNASHEMKTPLTAIRGEIEVLLTKERSSEEYESTLKIIKKETERLQELIQQLLDLEKTDALSTISDPEQLMLGDLILETIEQFPHHRIKLDFGPDSSDYMIRGNRSLIQTAFTNLIDNALKYSQNKPITISFNKENYQLKVCVIDHGIGIPEADIEQIFQPFFRAQNARAEKGHGIGLALVKKIIALHKGMIEYQSRPETGTKVSIYLPAI